MPLEVEIKFLVADLKTLERKLRAAGFRRVTPRTPERNTLYDLPGIPLRKRGELLRVRRYGKTWTLTHKAAARSGRHKSRTETETVVRDGARLDGILRALGFQPTFRYEKFRSQWNDGHGHVLLDETPIGNVAEIEGAPRWIDRTAKKLGTISLKSTLPDNLGSAPSRTLPNSLPPNSTSSHPPPPGNSRKF